MSDGRKDAVDILAKDLYLANYCYFSGKEQKDLIGYRLVSQTGEPNYHRFPVGNAKVTAFFFFVPTGDIRRIGSAQFGDIFYETQKDILSGRYYYPWRRSESK